MTEKSRLGSIKTGSLLFEKMTLSKNAEQGAVKNISVDIAELPQKPINSFLSRERL
jgi:hypothetical protein